MADILTEIVEKRKADIERLGVTFGFDIPEKRGRPVHPFLPEKGVILEVKRASPSKGDIAPDLDSAATANSYAEAGAAAISCLTEKNFFKGTLEDLIKVCEAVDAFEKDNGGRTAPAVLRKDFLINKEEIEIAYRAGADAVLLIARILDDAMIVEMAKAAAVHKMTSLVEVRSDEDIEKLRAVAETVSHEFIVCGVNSRDLATFKIDLLKPCALLEKIRGVLGTDARVIFESGIRTPQAARFVGGLGFTGMLLGEAAAKAPQLRAELVSSFVNAESNKNAEFWNTVSTVVECPVPERSRRAGCIETTADLDKTDIRGSFDTASGLLNHRISRSRPLIKICGLTRVEDVLYADSLGADFVGFIFAAGFGRNVCGEKFEAIIPNLKKVKAKKVAVITDPASPEADAAARYVEQGILDCIQLHGIEYEQVSARFLELPHYFAITEKNGSIEKAAEKLFLIGEPRFLQDSKSQGYDTTHPLWLAGGVTPENAGELVARYHPELIDVSSGVEDETVGIKNHEKLAVILNLIQDL